MKVKIFEALKTKYSNLGFTKEVLEGVATQLSAFVTEDSQIETAVAGSENVLKSFQSFADSRVNAFRTESNNYKTEAEQLKARLAELEKKPTPKPNEDVPDYVKSLETMMSEMKQTITGFQAEKNSQTLKEKFITQMSEKKVPESYFNATLIGRNFEDETKMQEFAEAVASNYQIHQQGLTDLGFSYTKPPEGGKGSVEKETEEFAKLIRQETQKIVEPNKN